MIVVMPNGHVNRTGALGAIATSVPAPLPAYTFAPGQARAPAGLYEESLVKDIIPWVEKHYRAAAGRDNRAIAGLSMGGANTVRTTLSNPGLFACIGVFSAGTRDVTEEVEKSFAKVKANAKLYYVGCGTADKLEYENTKTLIDVLRKVGMSYQYRETAHGHWWGAWRAYLAEFVPQPFNQEARK